MNDKRLCARICAEHNLMFQDQAELELREALSQDVPRERRVQGPEVRHPDGSVPDVGTNHKTLFE